MKNTPVDYQTARRIIDGYGLPDFGKATIREVVAISTQLEQETNTEFIHMEMGVPGLKAAQVGVDAEVKALQTGIASIYPNINGTPEVKAEASRFIKAFINIDIAPECCVPVTGSMQGTFASFLTSGQCTEGKDTILFIDKHAAHERMNFDRLMTSKEPPMRQTLLQPIAVEPGKEAAALLLDNLELLEQFGFGCEDFGDGAILVREVPADLDAADTAATLEEFAQNLRTGRNLDEKREALLHTMACKAAIKGGWKSDLSELRVLVDKVQSGEVQFCPHGRPVKAKLTKYELEKMFKRA